jgi:hypothetical protein
MCRRWTAGLVAPAGTAATNMPAKAVSASRPLIIAFLIENFNSFLLILFFY